MTKHRFKKTLAEVAHLIQGEVVGDQNVVVTGLCGIKEAQEGDLTFVAHPKYFSLVATTKASAIIAPPQMTGTIKPIIRTNNPSWAFARMLSLITGAFGYHPQGIHPTAIISSHAILEKDVSVGPYTVIERNARIGAGTTIYSGCFVGPGTTLGEECLIYPNTTIREEVTIGSRVIIHSGSVIGADGFGFTKVAGVQEKIPQVGTVVIEDDVEIGANVTIDRARFDKTFIGRGTKIDNLVQIAHNVTIGEQCIIVAQVGISGSVQIEDQVTLAGQAGVAGHLRIGAGVVVAAKSGVTKDIPPGTMVSGFPAQPHESAKKIHAHIQRLPQYIETIKALQKKMTALESELETLKSSLSKKH